MSFKKGFKTEDINVENLEAKPISPKLREELEKRSNMSSKRKAIKSKEREMKNRYQSESQRAYNEKPSGAISPILQQNGQTDRSLRNIEKFEKNLAKPFVENKQNEIQRDDFHGNQIYTFREQTKNIFRDSQIKQMVIAGESTQNDINESDITQGYFSPEEVSIDSHQTDKTKERALKKIIVQKNINFKKNIHKGKFI